jgi:hypothetical protein
MVTGQRQPGAQREVQVNGPDHSDHSFVIRLWLEETIGEARRASWRGQITHVMRGERSYFASLSDIAFFITPYLAEMGVRLGYWWRIRCWLNQHGWRSSLSQSSRQTGPPARPLMAGNRGDRTRGHPPR